MILNLNSQIIWVFVDLLILFVLMKKFLFGYDRPTYHSGFRNRYSAKQRNLERNMGLQFGIQFRFDFTQRASPRLSIEVGLRAYCKNLSEFTQAYETKKN